MNMQQCWKDNDIGKLQYLQKNLSQTTTLPTTNLHALALVQNKASVSSGQGLTARAMEVSVSSLYSVHTTDCKLHLVMCESRSSSVDYETSAVAVFLLFSNETYTLQTVVICWVQCSTDSTATNVELTIRKSVRDVNGLRSLTVQLTL
jgi:hypothetical protein